MLLGAQGSIVPISSTSLPPPQGWIGERWQVSPAEARPNKSLSSHPPPSSPRLSLNGRRRSCEQMHALVVGSHPSLARREMQARKKLECHQVFDRSPPSSPTDPYLASPWQVSQLSSREIRPSQHYVIDIPLQESTVHDPGAAGSSRPVPHSGTAPDDGYPPLPPHPCRRNRQDRLTPITLLASAQMTD